MALTDVALKKAKSREKPYRLRDSDGLYVIIQPHGAKWWRFDYMRPDKSRNTMSLGTYPDVTLAEARTRRDKARSHLKEGFDPVQQSKAEEAERQKGRDNTFGAIADEYLSRLEKQGRSPNTLTKNDWYLKVLAADLADRPIREITAAEILKVVKKIEASGRIETAHRARSGISSVFRLAVSTLRADTDPTFALRGALLPKNSTPQAAITDEKKFGGLLRSVDEFDGWPTLRAALQIMALCFPRPLELRKAEWEHVDLEKGEWEIPAEIMKMRRPHAIPLSRQAIAIFKEVGKFSGDGRLVFPSIRNAEKLLSENAMNSALRRMGYLKEEHTSHGFRSSASTILNARRFHPDVIERSLSHVDQNQTRRTYNRYEYWEERVDMMQAWADLCDEFKVGRRDNADLI